MKHKQQLFLVYGTRIKLADSTPGMIDANECDNLAEVRGGDWDKAFRETCQSKKYRTPLQSLRPVSDGRNLTAA